MSAQARSAEAEAPSTDTAPPLVEIKGLTKHFDIGKGQIVHAVDDVSFSIAENEIVGLVGESGSGKSTLGKTLLGLHDKTAGEVIYRGNALPQRYGTTDFGAYATRMQMIFQDPYSSLNPDHASRYPHEFSGGQRQRIGIARALILEPEFVVCDEPISALDVSVQAQIINLLADLKERLGLTLLFIAHDLSMVRYVSDRMAVMYLGDLLEIGPSDSVFFDPQHDYTKTLIASNPEPDPAYERERKRQAASG